uniref:Uncharacterized protein n=1 Tax=Cacopsylla melanoneura TaxID=428564 RepID=A0A8D9E3S2_9HEMI
MLLHPSRILFIFFMFLFMVVVFPDDFFFFFVMSDYFRFLLVVITIGRSIGDVLCAGVFGPFRFQMLPLFPPPEVPIFIVFGQRLICIIFDVSNIDCIHFDMVNIHGRVREQVFAS